MTGQLKNRVKEGLDGTPYWQMTALQSWKHKSPSHPTTATEKLRFQQRTDVARNAELISLWECDCGQHNPTFGRMVSSSLCASLLPSIMRYTRVPLNVLVSCFFEKRAFLRCRRTTHLPRQTLCKREYQTPQHKALEMDSLVSSTACQEEPFNFEKCSRMQTYPILSRQRTCKWLVVTGVVWVRRPFSSTELLATTTWN